MGVGVGIGGTAKAKLYGLNAAVSGVAKVDAVNIRTAEGNYKIGTKYDANLGVEIGPLKNYMGTTAFHSYNEKDCTCSWEKPIYDIYNCKNTIKEPINTSNTIGLDLSAYLGIGFTASLEFNLDYFVENTIKIFSED